jgi:DNA-binding CsgD family transcriptional regulator
MTTQSAPAPATWPGASPPGRTSLIRPLRGRHEALGRALQQLRAAAGSGRSALITCTGGQQHGLGGYGITSMLTEVTEQGRRAGFAIGAAACPDPSAGAGSPSAAAVLPWQGFGALFTALRSPEEPLVDEATFLELGSLHDRPLWFADRLAAALGNRAAIRPVLISLDDVHWADAWTVLALQILPVQLADYPVVWLLGSRDGGPLSDIAVAAERAEVPVTALSLGSLDDVSVQTLALDVLGEDATPAVLDAVRGAGGVPRLAMRLLEEFALVAERTSGSPGATSDVGLPAGFLICLRDRLAGNLSYEAMQLLQIGAVLGEFTLSDVAALSGSPVWELVEPLQESVRAGHLLDDGHRLRFTLPLVRSGIYQDLPASARNVLHRAAADHLAADDRPLTELAVHWQALAKPGDLSAVALLSQAAAQSEPATAVELLTSARALAMDSDPMLAADLGCHLVAALVANGAPAAAVELDDQMPDPIGPPEAEDRLAAVAPALWSVGQYDKLASRSAAIPNSVLAQAVAAAAATATSPVSVQLARSAHRAAVTARDARAAQWTHLALGMHALAQGRTGAAFEHFERSPSSMREIAELDAMLGVESLTDAGRRLHHADTQNPWISVLSARHALLLGRLADADRFAGEVLARSSPDHAGAPEEAALLLAKVAYLRGFVDLARQHLTLTARDQCTPRIALTRAVLTSQLLADQGRAPAAVNHLDDVGVAAVNGTGRANSEDVLAGIRLAVALDAPSLAARLTELLAGEGPDSRAAHDLYLQHARALCADDLDLLTDIHQRLAPSPRLLARADVDADLGRALLRRGQRDAGISALDRAWETYVGAAATQPARQLQRDLRAAGVRRHRWLTGPARPPTGVTSLTDAERRVAGLIAAGHSNRSAAAELAVSPNTIASHLRSVYAKLSVNSRVQLARLDLDRT